MKKLLVTLLTLAIFGVAGVAAYFYNFANSPASDEDQKIVFVVQPGPFSLIANQIAHIGAIKNAYLFTWYARLLGKTGSVKVGEYELNTNMKPREVLSTITSGKSMTYPITFQEGINMYEIADLLESRGFANKKEFLALCKNKDFIRELLGETLPSLEGYLFPNTYLFTKFTGVKDIIREMTKQFLHASAEADAESKKENMTRHEAVILASIIEKETGVPEERTLVSSVFHNRLKKKMMLQTDPTIIYGILDKTGVYPKNIRKSDIMAPTRYNTYTFRGLPFGPISNPGKEALKAAYNPEESEFLYFVSQNDGTHVFTSTYKDHANAVKKYQLDRRQRQGKSWRDLNKKKTN